MLLLEAGAEPDLPDSIGFTPLMAAAGANLVEMIQLFDEKTGVNDADNREKQHEIDENAGGHGKPKIECFPVMDSLCGSISSDDVCNGLLLSNGLIIF